MILGVSAFAVSMLFFAIGCTFSSLFIAFCAMGEITGFLGFLAVVLMGYRRIELRLDFERRELNS